MGTNAFGDLRVYQLAVDVADRVYAAVAAWNSFDRWTVGAQLVRAADSVGANIAEGCGRWHAADKRRLFVIARGSLYETEHWLQCAEARRLHAPRSADLTELAKTLNRLIRTAA